MRVNLFKLRFICLILLLVNKPRLLAMTMIWKQSRNQSSIPLVVTLSKRSGTSLEFSCVAYPAEIAIDRKPENLEEEAGYEGPEFHDLDENLKKAFHKYLENRGIKPSTTNFLFEYMLNKDSREYLMWLKNFIEA